MRFWSLACFASLFFVGTSANAALTSSEKGQLRDFVSTARPENAHKVRSLVARTDLTPEESAQALIDAVVPLAWSEQRGIFLKELVFGGVSAPSRPILAVATVKALLARADAQYQRFPGGLDHEKAALTELVSLYAFLDEVIANAGKPTSTAHDPNAGVPAATYEECSKVLRDHIEKNQRWLKGDGQVPDTIARLRAQAQVLLLDMLPDGLTRRIDAADRLGLKGPRRTMLTDYGILFTDAGTTEETKVAKLRDIIARLPGARSDLGLIYVGNDRSTASLRARGSVAYAATAQPYPFEDAAPGAYDPLTSAVAYELSVIAARSAMAKSADFKAQVEKDATMTSGDPGRLLGKPHAPSVESVLGAAIHTLVIDAPKAVDMSIARHLGGRPETLAVLSDAIGALAAFPIGKEPITPQNGPRIEVGKGAGSAFTSMTNVRLAPNGVSVAFTMDGHTWALDRASPTYQIMGARRDGQSLGASQLGSAKNIPRDGSSWSDSGVTFKKMLGTPRVAVSTGVDKAAPNVKLLGSGLESFDVVTTTPTGADFTLEGELTVKDGPGGIAIRLAPSKKTFKAITLIVTPGGEAALSVVDDGNETRLTTPSPAPAGATKITLTVKGNQVEAKLGGTTLKGTAPESFNAGEVALVAKKNASVELAGFKLKK